MAQAENILFTAAMIAYFLAMGLYFVFLGVKKEIILRRFTTQLPERFDLARGACKLNCAVFDIDRNSGKCTAAQSYELI